jgi:hypothetical protein
MTDLRVTEEVGDATGLDLAIAHPDHRAALEAAAAD